MDQNNEPQSASSPQPYRAFAGPVELISGAYRFFIQHWQILVIIAALPSLLGTVGSMLMSLKVFPTIVLGVVLVIGGAITSIAMVPALIDAVRKLDADPAAHVSFKGQYAFGFSYFWPVIWINIITVLVSVGAGILFIFPVVIVAIYTTLNAFTLIIDGKRGISALEESYALVKGRWWGVLGRTLFLSMIFLAIWLVSVGIAYLGSNMNLESATGEWLTGIVQLVINLVMGPIAMIFSYRMYQSLKETRVAAVSTAAFRKWMIGFICITLIIPIAVVLAIVVGFTM